MKLTCAHLKELKTAGLIDMQRQGRHVVYRLANEKVALFWVSTGLLAEDRSSELQSIIQRMNDNVHAFKPTRLDPFEDVAKELRLCFLLNPQVTAKQLLVELQKKYPGKYKDGVVRTLRRRVRAWRHELLKQDQIASITFFDDCTIQPTLNEKTMD